MERIQIHQTYQSSTNQNSLQTQTTYKCSICQDTEFIYDPSTNSARECKCRQVNIYRRLYEKSGISKLFASKTLSNFLTEGKPQVVCAAKKTSENYIKTFSGTESMALLGESGAGKTHLCIAVCNELLKSNVGVLYMQYRDALTSLKQQYVTRNDNGEAIYQVEIQKYKSAPVLYVDDLYKGKISESDVNIMFELINHRYINDLPILVSSELSCEQLLQIDKAVGGRILEMCRGCIVEFSGIGLNHRLI